MNIKKITTLGISTVLGIVSFAQAQVIVSETRVVLDENSKNTEITITNTSDEKYAVRLDLVDRKMEEDGTIALPVEGEIIENSGVNMVRFSPRQTLLEPKQHQIIRLSSNLQEGNNDGEYRAHLRIKSVPIKATEIINQRGQSEDNDGDLDFAVVVVRVTSIPIFINKGQLNADVAVSTVNLESINNKEGEKEYFITGTLERNGNKTTYVKIAAFDNKQKEMYSTGRIPIYHPLKNRTFKEELTKDQYNTLRGKDLKIKVVEFKKNINDASKLPVYEEKTIKL